MADGAGEPFLSVNEAEIFTRSLFDLTCYLFPGRMNGARWMPQHFFQGLTLFVSTMLCV
jgi:hypothetical protein